MCAPVCIETIKQARKVIDPLSYTQRFVYTRSTAVSISGDVKIR